MSWLRSAMTKAVEVGNNTNLTRAVVQHAGQAVAEGAKILQDRIAARNYRSVAQTIKRLEEAAITYRGPERVELLRRWLVVLKEVDKLSRAADDKEKTFEHHLGVEELKDNPRKPSLVERQFSECSKSLQWNKDRVRELETQLKSLQEDLISAKDAAAANEERLSAELSTKNRGKRKNHPKKKNLISHLKRTKIRPSDYSRTSEYSRPSDYSRWGSSDDDNGLGDSPNTTFLPAASNEDGYGRQGGQRFHFLIHHY
ncbi:nuclear-pore anchor-like isoform X2 [Arachis ipaensis]|uniref:nuclear-pore anchor-like isoform X2 n=1 Tax=Arachis ipaensis TaxID=130454 RepID=UPI000A2B5A9F|nr:nuclear-pore anchor-like isoform X2 [Arachis ipaensis]